MIGTIAIECNAKNPNMPLHPLRAYVNSPSSLRITNVPRKIGKWNINKVTIVAIYPDSTQQTAECVLTGGVWVGTIEGSTTAGTLTQGYTILADGVDENGNDVTGYVLGKGDVEIMQSSSTPEPEPSTTFVRLQDDGTGAKDGVMYPTESGYVIQQNGEAHLLGTPFDQITAYVDSAISSKADLSVLDDYAKIDELSAKADLSAIPSNTSQLSNDSGFVTSSDLELKQDKLSEAQLSAIDQDADTYLTKFYVQGESQMYSFIASNTLSKNDLAAQGVYDTTTGTWTKNLTSIRTGTNVTGLETNLFKDVTTLTYFEGPNFTGSGAQTFGGCTGLQTLTMPKISILPVNFCKDCTALRNLTMPASIKTIGRNAFQNCANLSVHFEEKSLAQVQAMLNYPWGLTTSNITASKTATQEWVEEQLPTKTSDLSNDSCFITTNNPWTCGWRLTFNGTPTDDSLSARLNGRLIAYTDNRKVCRFDCVLDHSNISELYHFLGMDFQAFITINDLSNLVDGYTKNITGPTLTYTDAWGYYKNEVPTQTEFDFLSVTFNIQE